MKTIAKASERKHEADSATAFNPLTVLDPKGEHARLDQNTLEDRRKFVAVNPLDFLSEDDGSFAPVCPYTINTGD